MTALVWDQTGDRLYETGVDRGVLFPADTENPGSFAAGVAWNGLTGVSESPSGAEESKQYADNIKYLGLRSEEEYGATINAFTYPEEFEACDGSRSIAAGVTVGQQTRLPFCFSYRSLIGNDTEFTDHGYKLHLIYNLTAAPSSRERATVNESPEAMSFSWSVSATKVDVPGYKPTATLEIDSTKVDATKLAALEKILYGDDSTEARIPMPAEVIELFAGTTGGEPATQSF